MIESSSETSSPNDPTAEVSFASSITPLASTEASAITRSAEAEATTWVAFRVVDDEGSPVAGRGFSLLLPDGTTVDGVTDAAREIDEDFNRELVSSHQEVPDWLAEHLENPYPDADKVAEIVKTEAEKTGRKAKVTIHYSENLAVAKSLRKAASTSKYLYLFGNLAAGFLLPLMPRASETNGYRAIILAEFIND